VFYGWVVVGTGFIILLTGLGVRFSYGVFFKSLEVDFNLTRGATSGIFSAYMLLCSGFAVLGGLALDRYGPRSVCLLMGSFTGLSLVLTSQTTSAWQLYISYALLLSLGTGPLYSVVNATVLRWFDKKRGLALSITTSGAGFGPIVTAPFATFLLSILNWGRAFMMLGIISWFFISSMSLLLRNDPAAMELLPDGERSHANQGASSIEEREDRLPGAHLIQALKTQQFWFLGSIWLLISLCLHLLYVHIIPFAVDMGYLPMDAALILSLMSGANIIGRLTIGQLSDATGRRFPAIASASLQVATLLWLMWARELWMLYGIAIVFGFGFGGLDLLVTALIGDVFGTRRIGTIMGLMSACWGIGAAAGPIVGGFAFDVTGSYFSAFGVGAGAMMTATLFACLVRGIR
jgi:OFA family oxalate/formate antiporter-like MFS transporter